MGDVVEQSRMLVKGRVKFTAGKEFDTKYGPRRNIVIELSNGQEVKIWEDASNNTLNNYYKGQEVLLMEENGKYQIARQENQQMASTALSSETVTQTCRIIVEAYKYIQQELPEVSPEQIQAMATSVFIHLSRRLP